MLNLTPHLCMKVIKEIISEGNEWNRMNRVQNSYQKRMMYFAIVAFQLFIILISLIIVVSFCWYYKK